MAINTLRKPAAVVDAYVLDVLLPDLVGHDRKPSAFIVYLLLHTLAAQAGRPRVDVSLQTLADKTGLSKSSVQGAIRHLRRRGLLLDEPASTTAPGRIVLKPWVR